MRRLQPLSSDFGFSRGQPVDRFYIEHFLAEYADDIKGCALEIAEAHYTQKFSQNHVTRSEVLHAVEGNPEATIVGDLSTGEGIPKEHFDCAILTQVFPFIYDLQPALASLYEALRPNGVALITLPGISQISRYDADRWGDFWRFTDMGANRLLGDIFGAENIQVKTFGNVLTAAGILYGLAAEEFHKNELEYHDPDYQVLIGIRAVKS